VARDLVLHNLHLAGFRRGRKNIARLSCIPEMLYRKSDLFRKEEGGKKKGRGGKGEGGGEWAGSFS